MSFRGTGLPKNYVPFDADTGANNLQNYPELAAVRAGSVTTVLGTLNSQANRTFTLDFYASPAADPSGYGEGQHYLGCARVTTDLDGTVSFLVSLPASTTAGEVITATATGPDGTSEFSLAVPAQAAVGDPGTV